MRSLNRALIKRNPGKSAGFGRGDRVLVVVVALLIGATGTGCFCYGTRTIVVEKEVCCEHDHRHGHKHCGHYETDDCSRVPPWIGDYECYQTDDRGNYWCASELDYGWKRTTP